ncbi:MULTISPECIES: sporulation protein YqfC [Pontibacillus]|uniref:Sporulation protein YqfC n=2 Tax=Pontibacillus TaxID=289201 RepID=A0ABQ1PVS8_9BACI|nr:MULTISPECIES: sporulation protein YqfC [Pontibacillus]MCD5323616.1 sporulation protein YqfC [Pontibacillus sp. HN14]WIF96984.1 sporulation protein YqfC [Pontibacillus chungwhensis]GGD04500.1 sporulation protein YqfC [Pontibacillus salipaludis]
MKKWQQRIGNWLSQQLDLPTDVILELPRITTIGQIHAYVENHKGLISFSDEELRLKLKQGQLLIKGKGFVLRMMLPEEILLEGTIHEVTFIDQNG